MLTNANYRTDANTEIDSGNVVRLLAELSGEKDEKIEALLQTGKTPWELSQELGVLSEFKDVILGHMLNRLDLMVAERQITQEYADELVAYFEMDQSWLPQ